jgi:YHS domain-containing protein
VARFLLLMVLVVVIARTFWRFVDAVARGAAGPASQPGGRPGGPPSAVKMQQCPVCGTYVVPGKAISAPSGGQTMYFDTESCRAKYQSR